MFLLPNLSHETMGTYEQRGKCASRRNESRTMFTVVEHDTYGSSQRGCWLFPDQAGWSMDPLYIYDGFERN